MTLFILFMCTGHNVFLFCFYLKVKQTPPEEVWSITLELIIYCQEFSNGPRLDTNFRQHFPLKKVSFKIQTSTGNLRIDWSPNMAEGHGHILRKEIKYGFPGSGKKSRWGKYFGSFSFFSASNEIYPRGKWVSKFLCQALLTMLISQFPTSMIWDKIPYR